jgi:hypothetical protein
MVIHPNLATTVFIKANIMKTQSPMMPHQHGTSNMQCLKEGNGI